MRQRFNPSFGRRPSLSLDRARDQVGQLVEKPDHQGDPELMANEWTHHDNTTTTVATPTA